MPLGPQGGTRSRTRARNDVDVVNIMTFDYYDRVTRDMGSAAISAAQGLLNRLTTQNPSKTTSELWAMEGNTICQCGQFAIASGAKGLTAVAVASLIEDGSLELSTTAPSVLGRDLGDGGIYSTVADISSFWGALLAGQIVSAARAAELVRPRSDVPRQSMRYSLGFQLHESNKVVMLEGRDAGVSFRSGHDPEQKSTYTVISNTSEGAWPVARLLAERFST